MFEQVSPLYNIYAATEINPKRRQKVKSMVVSNFAIISDLLLTFGVFIVSVVLFLKTSSNICGFNLSIST